MGEKVFVAAMKGRERLDFDEVKHIRGRGESQHLSDEFFGVVKPGADGATLSRPRRGH